MVQRKTDLCCSPPASWVSDVPAHTSCLAHPLCLWPSGPLHLPATLLPTSQSSHPLLLHQLTITCSRDWGSPQKCYVFFECSLLISGYAIYFGRKASIDMVKICFFSHVTAVPHLLWAPQSHLHLLLPPVDRSGSPSHCSAQKQTPWLGVREHSSIL